GAILGDVADAAGRPARRRARHEGVARTRRRRAGAILGDVADAGRRPAGCGARDEGVARTRRGRSGAVLCDVADASRGAAYGRARRELARCGAARRRAAVPAAEVALLGAVAAGIERAIPAARGVEADVGV